MLLGDPHPPSLLINLRQLLAQLGHYQGVGEDTLGNVNCLELCATTEQLCCECKICENDMNFVFKIT
jgi:hypothetical protein